MQVDHIKPTLKAPEIKRLKLQCDGPLSKFAFSFNLRRYNKHRLSSLLRVPMRDLRVLEPNFSTSVRRCRFNR